MPDVSSPIAVACCWPGDDLPPQNFQLPIPERIEYIHPRPREVGRKNP